MNFNFDNFTLEELLDLLEDVQKVVAKRREQHHSETVEKIRQLAQAAGVFVTIDTQEHIVMPPKYVNPNNSKDTWSGRGRQPLWFRDAIAAGYSLESLLIAKSLDENSNA